MKSHNNRKIGKLVIITAISVLALISIKGFAIGWSCDPIPETVKAFDPDIEIIDNYGDDDGYYIFSPVNEALRNDKVIGFIHGYGALNPKIFGAWIKHLVKQGNTVIYPRYQKNLVFPSATEFTPNVVSALESAISVLKEKDLINEDFELFLAGHSFGGVIAANIIGEMSRYDIPEPSGILVAEGGTGPLTGALLDNYGAIPREIPLVIVVGDKDWTVGDYFGRRLFAETRSVHRVLIHQHSYKKGSKDISSSHYEPYGIDNWCDNGMENITTKRAEMTAKLDILDRNGYWRWLDLLLGGTDDWEKTRGLLFNPQDPIALMQDGEVLEGVLEVHYPSKP